MSFQVIAAGARPLGQANRAFLIKDNWDDWFEFSTLYSLVVFDATGEQHAIGGVKIGQFKMKENQRAPDLPEYFEELDERFFSLGQDDSYYGRLNQLGPEIRDIILSGLRDVAHSPQIFQHALSERVTGFSLLRSVDKSTVLGQFNRMSHGGVRLTSYRFTYTARPHSKEVNPLALDFSVTPDSYPPTNVHVLIGRNGVGKTTLLQDMARAIVDSTATPRDVGAFSVPPDSAEESPFAGIVSVTFSAFDKFEPIDLTPDRSTGVRYSYVGLKQRETDEDSIASPKGPDELSDEFARSIRICRQGAKSARWKRALEKLQTDPIFSHADVLSLAESGPDSEDDEDAAHSIFKRLSSGHKIVLLTITRLVETVEEKTLVVLDEPEAHLHPPLLSAFVRALSELLIDRNGVAIIATHSPVVTQEVPASCVWVIRRVGARAFAERPEIQTFGENVGLLTREVFGLEVSQSGFHQMLRETVEDSIDYETVLRHFNNELGGEARAIVQALLATRHDFDDEQT